MTVPELPSTRGGDPVFVIACREFVELVTEHLEGTLPWRPAHFAARTATVSLDRASTHPQTGAAAGGQEAHGWNSALIWAPPTPL
jgi:hypothetical protein